MRQEASNKQFSSLCRCFFFRTYKQISGKARLQNRPYFCVFKYARAVKQKVWNEAKNRERDWGETLKIRRYRKWKPMDPKKKICYEVSICQNNHPAWFVCERPHKKIGLPALQPHLYILTTITSKYPYLGLKLYMY